MATIYDLRSYTMLARSYPYDRARSRRNRPTGSGNSIPRSMCLRARLIRQRINDTIVDIYLVISRLVILIKIIILSR
jgi:hypothetical protein